jgi:hypothetical protein
MTTQETLFTLALDMPDAFGSVSHVQLKNNISQVGFYPLLSEVIMDSYANAKV